MLVAMLPSECNVICGEISLFGRCLCPDRVSEDCSTVVSWSLFFSDGKQAFRAKCSADAKASRSFRHEEVVSRDSFRLEMPEAVPHSQGPVTGESTRQGHRCAGEGKRLQQPCVLCDTLDGYAGGVRATAIRGRMLHARQPTLSGNCPHAFCLLSDSLWNACEGSEVPGLGMA